MVGIICIVLLMSCNPFRNFKTRQLESDGKILSLSIPNRYIKEESRIDSLGNKLQVFNYGNGAYLYFATVKDSVDLQLIDKEKNIAKLHSIGGIFYKGIDAKGLFWREVQIDNLRYGYKNVTRDSEIKFDSAINFVKIIK